MKKNGTFDDWGTSILYCKNSIGASRGSNYNFLQGRVWTQYGSTYFRYPEVDSNVQFQTLLTITKTILILACEDLTGKN